MTALRVLFENYQKCGSRGFRFDALFRVAFLRVVEVIADGTFPLCKVTLLNHCQRVQRYHLILFVDELFVEVVELLHHFLLFFLEK